MAPVLCPTCYLVFSNNDLHGILTLVDNPDRATTAKLDDHRRNAALKAAEVLAQSI